MNIIYITLSGNEISLQHATEIIKQLNNPITKIKHN